MGYVIGLHGRWGSGKSTVLNFIQAHIEKHNQEVAEATDKITFVDFRPWVVSGHQDLVAAFFKILSESLGPADGLWMRRWKQCVRYFKGTSDTLVDAVATVAITVDPTGGLAARASGNIAKWSIDQQIGAFLEEPSLQSAYDKLKSQLAQTRCRFLVSIDDLDRLEDAEVRSIVQMVKTVARLPNVVYILAYDREIVWKALDGPSTGRNGPRFAEKIVQQEVELPRASRHSLLTMLDREIGFLTGSTDDSLRWSYIVRDGVQHWVRHPRDVLRLANAIKFSWPALG